MIINIHAIVNINIHIRLVHGVSPIAGDSRATRFRGFGAEEIFRVASTTRVSHSQALLKINDRGFRSARLIAAPTPIIRFSEAGVLLLLRRHPSEADGDKAARHK